MLRPLAVLAALLLAGCAGPDEPTPDEAPDEASIALSPTDDGARDPLSMVSHAHNMWQGKQRLVVVDQTLERNWVLGGGAYALVTFFPHSDAFVPYGTRSVEVTTSWQETRPGAYGAPELWLQTAADQDPVPVGPLENGGLITIPVEDSQADLPHQAMSRWEFAFAIPSAPELENPVTTGLNTFGLTISMKAEAVKGADEPEFPPHPDLWQNRTEMPLVNGAGGDTLLWLHQGYNCWLCTGGVYWIDPDDGAVVPPDAAVVRATLSYAWTSPTGLKLMYHGADSKEWLEAPVTSDDGKVRIHDIPVPGKGDSVYAQQSQWKFGWAFDGGEVGAYSGSWSLQALTLHHV